MLMFMAQRQYARFFVEVTGSSAMRIVVHPSRGLSGPSVAQMGLKQSSAELVELQDAIASDCIHLVLDEVTDAICIYIGQGPSLDGSG